jgi:tetratricopeptide (TPR) repeat protein
MKEYQSNKSKSPALIAVGIVTLIALIAVLVYSELEKIKTEEMQEQYHSQIKNIENYLNEGNCTQAAFEYAAAKETRDVIVKRGLYYSLGSHAKQAHAIVIAECFAKNKEFERAVILLDSEINEDPDYLSRASVIYKKAGEPEKAEKAKSKAEKY